MDLLRVRLRVFFFFFLCIYIAHNQLAYHLAKSLFLSKVFFDAEFSRTVNVPLLLDVPNGTHRNTGQTWDHLMQDWLAFVAACTEFGVACTLILSFGRKRAPTLVKLFAEVAS